MVNYIDRFNEDEVFSSSRYWSNDKCKHKS